MPRSGLRGVPFKPQRARFGTAAREIGVEAGPGTCAGQELDAVDRAGWHAQLAAGATVGEHAMHELGGPDDRVDRTGRDTQRAADARCFVDAGDHLRSWQIDERGCGVVVHAAILQSPRCDRRGGKPRRSSLPQMCTGFCKRSSLAHNRAKFIVAS